MGFAWLLVAQTSWANMFKSKEDRSSVATAVTWKTLTLDIFDQMLLTRCEWIFEANGKQASTIYEGQNNMVDKTPWSSSHLMHATDSKERREGSSAKPPSGKVAVSFVYETIFLQSVASGKPWTDHCFLPHTAFKKHF